MGATLAAGGLWGLFTEGLPSNQPGCFRYFFLNNTQMYYVRLMQYWLLTEIMSTQVMFVNVMQLEDKLGQILISLIIKLICKVPNESILIKITFCPSDGKKCL